MDVQGVFYPPGDKDDPAALPQPGQFSPDLHTVAALTGGTLVQELRLGHGIVALCAEDAWALRLPVNGYASVAANMLTRGEACRGGPLCGGILFVGITDDGEYADLPETPTVYTAGQ